MDRLENRGMPLHRLGYASHLRLFGTHPAPADNPALSAIVRVQYCSRDVDRAFLSRVEVNQLCHKFFVRHVDYVLSKFGP